MYPGFEVTQTWTGSSVCAAEQSEDVAVKMHFRGPGINDSFRILFDQGAQVFISKAVFGQDLLGWAVRDVHFGLTRGLGPRDDHLLRVGDTRSLKCSILGFSDENPLA